MERAKVATCPGGENGVQSIGSRRIESPSPTPHSCYNKRETSDQSSSLNNEERKPIPEAPSCSANELEPTSLPSFIEEKIDRTRLSLDSFEVHGIIGEGGFGKVALVSHPASDKELAMKMVKKRRDPVGALTERHVLQITRNSPFTTNLYGTFQTEQHLFYVMEYIHAWR
ncbi:protein kinase C delta type-like [Pyxicephalus adspersus]|uniref:protein kinase C delta type-like n=1 Tax=Pyxicephalus adspersus TaxID=30357 RepID=UPI003B59A353